MRKKVTARARWEGDEGSEVRIVGELVGVGGDRVRNRLRK